MPAGRGARAAALLLAVTMVSTASAADRSGAISRQAAPRTGIFEYIVKRDDTLIGITRDVLDDPSSWPIIQRLNGVPIPRLMQIGTHILIPNELLRGQPSLATVTSATGGAQADGKPLADGARVGESAWVQTDANAVVTLRLTDGSTLRLAPSSQLHLDRLRQYHDPAVVEARVRLERGRIDAHASPDRIRPLDIRTPVAVAAVRGTDYRVTADNGFASTEVLTGTVAWSPIGPSKGAGGAGAGAGGAGAAVAGETLVRAGFGAGATTDRGVTPAEALLAAPSLATLPGRVTVLDPEITFQPVPAARQYRVQVARDERFDKVITDQRTVEPRARFVTGSDGLHYVRVRPIAASGVEGLDAVAVIDVQARPLPPAPARPRTGAVVFEEQLAFGWGAVPGVTRYQVQLASDEQFERLIDQQQVDGEQVTLALKPAAGDAAQDRWWRVAAIEPGTSRIGPYGLTQRLQWRAVPGAPIVVGTTFDAVSVRWSAPGGQRQQLELATDARFGADLRQLAAVGESTRIEGLRPGRWHIRRRTEEPDGSLSPWSVAATFELRPFLSSSDGKAVASGDGGVIGIQPEN